MGSPVFILKRVQMKNISYYTWRTRIKLGWCNERAKYAVPIPTHVGMNQHIPTDDFEFLVDLVRITNDNHRHRYRATCICGQELILYNTELLFDVHCGCCDGGTSPIRLNWLEMTEQDEEYCEHAKKNGNVPSCAGWFVFRHF